MTQHSQQPLFGPDGLIRGRRLVALGDPDPIQPDQYGAAQLLLVASRITEQGATSELTDELHRILSTRPVLPLLNGLAFVGLAFAQIVYGERRTECLDQACLGYGMRDGAEEAK